jgi:hypothetical protein
MGKKIIFLSFLLFSINSWTQSSLTLTPEQVLKKVFDSIGKIYQQSDTINNEFLTKANNINHNIISKRGSVEVISLSDIDYENQGLEKYISKLNEKIFNQIEYLLTKYANLYM